MLSLQKTKIITPGKECEVFKMTKKKDLMLKKYKSVSFVPERKTTCHLQIFYSHVLSTSLIEVLLSQFFPSSWWKQQIFPVLVLNFLDLHMHHRIG